MIRPSSISGLTGPLPVTPVLNTTHCFKTIRNVIFVYLRGINKSLKRPQWAGDIDRKL